MVTVTPKYRLRSLPPPLGGRRPGRAAGGQIVWYQSPGPAGRSAARRVAQRPGLAGAGAPAAPLAKTVTVIIQDLG